MIGPEASAKNRMSKQHSHAIRTTLRERSQSLARPASYWRYSNSTALACTDVEDALEAAILKA
jgi:hypothetical protein